MIDPFVVVPPISNENTSDFVEIHTDVVENGDKFGIKRIGPSAFEESNFFEHVR